MRLAAVGLLAHVMAGPRAAPPRPPARGARRQGRAARAPPRAPAICRGRAPRSARRPRRRQPTRAAGRLGTIDRLVGNAGVMLPGPIEEGRAAEWPRLLDEVIAFVAARCGTQPQPPGRSA